MPDGSISTPGVRPVPRTSLAALEAGKNDALGVKVQQVVFRSQDYAIYRSERGIYVHFSDDKEVEHDQRAAYVKLAPQICELRYLTSQMRPSRVGRLVDRWTGQDTLYDHNMAQALMLLMEAVAQRRIGQPEVAAATEQEAKDIAKQALDMAIRRITVDNTIRYVRICVVFGLIWLCAALLLRLAVPGMDRAQYYLLASALGVVGAVFSVIVRAQSLSLKPCEDSGMNKLMSLIRVGMGGLAGPVLFLLLTTVAANALPGMADLNKSAGDPDGFLRMVAIIGLIGGFAERLVPNLIQNAVAKAGGGAGTPAQASQAARRDGATGGGKTP